MVAAVNADLEAPGVGPGADGRQLVVLAFTGVQAFIAASRRTADLHAASRIVAGLVTVAARAVDAAGDAVVVYPAVDAVFPPNRVVALVGGGRGAHVAGVAVAAVQARWAQWCRSVFPKGGDAGWSVGFPSVQWVCVPASGDYAAMWQQAQQALRSRRAVRDFPGVEWPGRRLCDLSPQWPAAERPPAAPQYDDDSLAVANWVKRCWRDVVEVGEAARFPSTSSIASAPMRRVVLQRLGETAVAEGVEALRAVVDGLPVVPEEAVAGLGPVEGRLGRWLVRYGGPWVFPATWDADRLRREYKVTDPAVATAGRAAAAELADAVGGAPSAYLAVVAQDLDGLGRFLSGEDGRLGVSVGEHRAVSARLAGLGGEQLAVVSDGQRHGVAVYAGGDDLLAFAPASTALEVAEALQSVQPEELPTASTAVVFFHRSAPLRRAVETVQELLEQAKRQVAGKHALAVGFVRRSGTRQYSVQPWLPPVRTGEGRDGVTASGLFKVFLEPSVVAGRGLSPRLLGEFQRDATQLEGLARECRPVFEAEVSRLVLRHGGSPADAAALLRLGYGEAGDGAGGSVVPVRAAQVAVFLRQECGAGR